MSAARRAVLWGLIVIFAAACLWWALYVPYRPEDLFRPIPSNATFVSRHRDLAKRWDRMYANPLVLSLFLSAGVRPSALKTWAEDPQTRAWFDRLAGRDAVLAYVPPRVSHGEPTWIVTSWLGGRSQRLRWQLAWQRPKKFFRMPPRHGHPYWVVDTREIAPGTVLTFTVVEGMLIGCVSESERTILDLLDTYDGLRPSLRFLLGDPAFKPAQTTSDTFDTAWVKADFPYSQAARAHSLGFEFSEVSATSFVCRAYLPAFEAPSSGREADLAALAKALGDAPVCMASLPLRWLLSASRDRAAVWQEAIRRLAGKQQADWVVLALLGSPYHGRVAGLRMPAMVGALPLTAPEKLDAQINDALDFINSRSRWGLIPYRWHEARFGETSEVAVVVLDGTGQNLYASLAPEAKPAYAVLDNWLLLASQGSVLTQLLARAGTSSPCLEKAMKPTPVWFWGDFRSGGDALRLALSAYAFKLLMEDAAGSQARRQRINEWKAWLDALEPLEQCVVHAAPWEYASASGVNGKGLLLTIEMGRRCP